MEILIETTPHSVSVRLMNETELGVCTITTGLTPTIHFYIDSGYVEYTMLMISKTCSLVKSYFNDSHRIYVDADASEGLWDKLGFIENPLYEFTEDQRHLEGAGYEKYILFGSLCMFV